ncbi:MAG: DUF805 domain-containing protein [Gammaproteobacteria bacterium]|nr:DUF805 domain-containing protein [Gammaproteobacteria bacterium]
MNIDSIKVVELRKSKHWSQEQLADACGINLRTIQRVENTGKGSVETVRALASVFEIEPETIIILPAQEKPLSPLEAIKSAFIRFNDFSGTASRYEYWWFFLFVLIVAALATVLHEKAYQIVAIIVLVPFIAVGTRRLNDIKQSAWWQLLWLVPFGQIVVLVLSAQKSKE